MCSPRPAWPDRHAWGSGGLVPAWIMNPSSIETGRIIACIYDMIIYYYNYHNMYVCVYIYIRVSSIQSDDHETPKLCIPKTPFVIHEVTTSYPLFCAGHLSFPRLVCDTGVLIHLRAGSAVEFPAQTSPFRSGLYASIMIYNLSIS